MKTYRRYDTLRKPAWAPPAWIFGPVWTVLYVMIMISFGTVFALALQGRLAWMIALPFILNLIFNFAYTPIQFTLKNNMLASADILLVLATLLWLMIVIYPIAPWILFAQIPYLLWVGFATVLQLTITKLNA